MSFSKQSEIEPAYFMMAGHRLQLAAVIYRHLYKTPQPALFRL